MVTTARMLLVFALILPIAAWAGSYGKKEERPTIVEIAAGSEDFETLVAAVKAAGLVETLSGEGPFTVFAPTEAAFAALPEGTVEALLADTEALKKVLTYHVVSGKVMAGDLLKAANAPTVQGGSLQLGLTVNQARVVAADVKASNGVIHVIDAVLLPPDMM